MNSEEMTIPISKSEKMDLSGKIIKEEPTPGHTHHKSDPKKKRLRKQEVKSRKINQSRASKKRKFSSRKRRK